MYPKYSAILLFLLEILHNFQGSAVFTPETNCNSNNGSKSACLLPKKVICYFTNWSTNRTGKSQFHVSDIPEDTICTHIIYSFAILNPSTLTMEMSDPEMDSGSQNLYQKVTALKSKGIKVSIALGGWADSSNGTKYSEMITSGRARSNFVHKTVEFLRRHEFDGLDLHWEFPRCWQENCSAGPITDKNNFANLVKELKIAFKFYKLLLSVAVSSNLTIATAAYDIRVIADNVDWIGVMSYDMHNHTYSKTSHHSPYMGSQRPNTVDSLDFWVQKGIPSEKIIMGIPFYGRSFTLTNPSWTGVGVPATVGRPRPFTKEAGFIAYFELCVGWTYKQVSGVGSYAVKDDQWISYNDINLIQEKVEHVKQYGLGGVMVWALDLDDFSGEFCEQGIKYPLMTAIKAAFLSNK